MAGKPKKTGTAKASPAKAKPRPSLAGLQKDLTTIEARLKRAEAATRRKTKTLKDEFEALVLGTRTHSKTLDTQLTSLTTKLEDDMAQLQAKVSRELSLALANPTTETLESVIAQASRQIDASEIAQRKALSIINQSLADLALAVDARLSKEEKTRRDAMNAMKQAQDGLEARLQSSLDKSEANISVRLSSIESENAKALSTVGDKVISVAEDLKTRTQDSEISLKQQLNELSLQNKAELDRFRSSVMRRIETLEDNLKGTDSHLDRSVASLGSRLEGLEYGLTPQTVSPITPSEDEPALAKNLNIQVAVPNDVVDAFTPDNAQYVTTPQPETQNPAPLTEPVVTNPYSVSPQQPLVPNRGGPTPHAQPIMSQEGTVEYQGEAIPYDPSSYANPYESQTQTPESVQQAIGAPQQLAPPPPPQPHLPQTPTPQSHALQPHSQTPEQSPEGLAVQDIPLPYADPAYAEASASVDDQSMKSARPGFFKPKKAKTAKKPKVKKQKAGNANATPLLTPRNLRVGAMAAGLGVMVFVASQTVLKSDPPNDNPLVVERSQGSMSPTQVSQNGGVKTDPPIGQYADNQAPQVQTGSRSETVLENNVNAGDPVAQLQLGLSYLESGKTDEGVKLIRQAANQDQPAALYRLAKLYESGEGVSANAETARQLTDRAARGGNRIAMHDLALYYAEGRGGVDIDMNKAAEWFEKAAQRGVVDSQFNLGVLYESGQGVERRVETAFYWYGVAANQGDQTAQARLTILRDQLPADLVTTADAKISAFKPRKIDPAANGIFKSDTLQTASHESVLIKEKITKTQTLLSDLGYEVGAADGAIGPKTRAAIISFERSNGLPETGRVNATLVERLELAAGA